ncbi:MAG: TetR/AcrR family transcriptional regulator [Caulobacteraceae bacterium]|nr:TetR/AcrR family transcriptional regulator [Caulobacteraceae bacterium]
MAVSQSPRWRRRKEERPAEIVAAALAVFAEKGFAAARVEDIAARAGVSKGAVYLYFADKQALFRAVVAEVAPNLERIEALAAQHQGDFPGLVRALLPQLARTAGESRLGAVAKVVIGESRNFPELARIWHDALVSRALTLAAGLIARAQARGEVRDGDPRAYAFGLVAPLVMGLIWRETFTPVGAEPFDLLALARQHAETALEGMLKRRAA